MATPGELVTTMASVLGISEGTVAQFDRQLAEAGLRSKSGRGLSAARVKPQDAANLLISIAASPIAGLSAKQAAQTCKAYGSLPIHTGPLAVAPFGQFGIPSLERLPRRHTFSAALSKLIGAAAIGEQFGIWEDGEFKPFDALLAVAFESPNLWAEISGDPSVTNNGQGGWCRMVYRPAAKGDVYSVIEGDLDQRRHVTFATIRTLGKLFSDRAQSIHVARS